MIGNNPILSYYIKWNQTKSIPNSDVKIEVRTDPPYLCTVTPLVYDNVHYVSNLNLLNKMEPWSNS